MVDDFKISNEKNIALLAGIISASFSMAQFLTSSFWGHCSDKYGRRNIIILGLVSNTTATLCFGLAQSYWLALLARLVSGLFNANLSVCKSILADVTNYTNRPLAFAFMEMAWGLGIISGPLLGGLLSDPSSHNEWFANIQFFKKYKYFLPCLCASVIGIMCLIAVLTAFEETCCMTDNYQFLLQTGPDDDIEQLGSRNRIRGASAQAPRLSTMHTAASSTFFLQTNQFSLSDIFGVLRRNISDHTDTSEAEVIWDAYAQGIEHEGGSRDEVEKTPFIRPLSIKTISSYAILCFQSIIFEEFFSLWCVAPKGKGLNLNTGDFGLILGLMGILNIFFQLLIFPMVAHRWKMFGIYQGSLLIFCFIWLGMPILAELRLLAHLNVYFMPLFIILLAFRRFAVVHAYTSVNIMVSLNSFQISLTAEEFHLGLVNGLAQTVSSLARATGNPILRKVHSSAVSYGQSRPGKILNSLLTKRCYFHFCF
jgi:MFS family permease